MRTIPVIVSMIVLFLAINACSGPRHAALPCPENHTEKPGTSFSGKYKHHRIHELVSGRKYQQAQSPDKIFTRRKVASRSKTQYISLETAGQQAGTNRYRLTENQIEDCIQKREFHQSLIASRINEPVNFTVYQQIKATEPQKETCIITGKTNITDNPPCDTIFHISGNVIFAIVKEVRQDEISYRLCDESAEKEHILAKKEVSSIKYSDGRIDYFNPIDKKYFRASKGKIEPFSLASFISTLVSILLFFTGSGSGFFFLLGLILAMIGWIRIERSRKKFRGKAFAGFVFVIVGIVIGWFLIAIIFLAFYFL